MIYLIGFKLEKKHYIKIGVSKTPELRLRKLQTGSAFKLQIFNLYLSTKLNYDYFKLEKYLHNSLHDYVKLNEWFEFSLDFNFVKEIEQILFNFDKDFSIIKINHAVADKFIPKIIKKKLTKREQKELNFQNLLTDRSIPIKKRIRKWVIMHNSTFKKGVRYFISHNLLTMQEASILLPSEYK